MLTMSKIPAISSRPISNHPISNHQGKLGWASSLVAALSELLRCLRRRWRLHRMQALDDHILDDIGVTREELLWAIDLPLRVNAALALHDRARRRRAAAQAG